MNKLQQILIRHSYLNIETLDHTQQTLIPAIVRNWHFLIYLSGTGEKDLHRRII